MRESAAAGLTYPPGIDLATINQRVRIWVGPGMLRKAFAALETVLATEDEAVKFLKATYRTEAPLSLRYADGSKIEVKEIQRIYHRAYAI